jgi:hypothetical protein
MLPNSPVSTTWRDRPEAWCLDATTRGVIAPDINRKLQQFFEKIEHVWRLLT